MQRVWVLGCLLLSPCLELRADEMLFRHGEQLEIDFSIWNYGWNNPGYCPYPTLVGFELAGFAPPSSPVAPLPGSSAQYYSGILLQGWLESLDHLESVPLFEANANRLGLAAGSLVAVEGVDNRATVDASVSLTTDISESIFGRGMDAIFLIENMGSDFTVGLGKGYSLRNAISAPGVLGEGFNETAGIISRVATIAVPEPANRLRFMAACLVLLLLGKWLSSHPPDL